MTRPTDHPLAITSGITPGNVADFLDAVDVFTLQTWCAGFTQLTTTDNAIQPVAKSLTDDATSSERISVGGRMTSVSVPNWTPTVSSREGSMAADDVLIVAGTPESREMGEKIGVAIARCERLNQIPYADADAVRAAWSELTGQTVDDSFRLVPPIRVDHGVNVRVGRNVFINHGCTISDIGGIDIGDDVLIAPNVSLLSSGHPVEPFERTRRVTAAPIVIGRNVWIGAGSTVLQGVNIGDDAVVAAGAVVAEDVPPATVVGGIPARVIREL